MLKIEQMEERQYKIYCLKNPTTNEIKYVGVTVNDISKRLSQHISDTVKNPQLYKAKWISSILKQGIRPIIEVIEICNKDTWADREIFWIKKYKEEGIKLTNILPGGKGVVLTRRKGDGSSKPIHKYDIDGNYIESFKSATEASKVVGVRGSSIGRVLSGERGTSGGFQWSFIKHDKLKPYRNYQHFKIRCYKMVPEFYKDYDSVQDAMKDLDKDFSAISESYTHKRPTKGYLFEKI